MKELNNLHPSIRCTFKKSETVLYQRGETLQKLNFLDVIVIILNKQNRTLIIIERYSLQNNKRPWLFALCKCTYHTHIHTIKFCTMQFSQTNYSFCHLSRYHEPAIKRIETLVKPLQPGVAFLYPLETSENLNVFQNVVRSYLKVELSPSKKVASMKALLKVWKMLLISC